MGDLVPSENRNSIYSLIPTIFSFIGIFVLPIAGSLIDTYGLAAGITCAAIVCLIGTILISIGIYMKDTTVEASIAENSLV